MSSLITGFENDIFISYRQKDNKGERWVNEFVESLKTELESTFKEEISIYFDNNPHDGLLETHDVDASLKEKLKCMVFIPILSRTYCDPKSFAWRNEFEAFAEQASKDLFGLKVKLPNGNVANRILPVRIHDLDSNDIKLCESITGGALRDIEFIYRSEGVSRPLRAKEDNPGDNQSKTYYRDQVNKTALAVKEIILGLKGDPDLTVKKSSEEKAQEQEFYKNVKPAGSKKVKTWIGAGILIILLFVVMIFYPGLLGRNDLESLVSKDGRIPIAVMPFQNMTNDTAWDVWQSGIQNNLITALSNSMEFKVNQTNTITTILKSQDLTIYASLSPSVAGLVSKKLGTNVYMTGSIKQSGDIIRLNAQLINTKKGEAMRSFQAEGIKDSILQVIDSVSLGVQKFLLISVLKEELPPYYRKYKVLTHSPEAYQYYLYGNRAFDKFYYQEAIDWYLKAIGKDSSFFSAMSNLAAVYYNQAMYSKNPELYKVSSKWILKVYDNREKLPSYGKIWADMWYATFFGTPYDIIKGFNELKKFDDQNPSYTYNLGMEYWLLSEYDKAISEFKQSLKIYKKWGTKPSYVNDYTVLGEVYNRTDQLGKMKRVFEKAERDFPEDPDASQLQAVRFLKLGDTSAASKCIKKHISIWQAYYSSTATELQLAILIARIYGLGNAYDKAEEYYRKALSLAKNKPQRYNDLATLLFTEGIDINEGIKYIDSAIALQPDNYNWWHTKGWGLYKQGKYKEALNILQKADSLKPVCDEGLYVHLGEVKKAVASLK